jgi:hypothetical protein
MPEDIDATHPHEYITPVSYYTQARIYDTRVTNSIHGNSMAVSKQVSQLRRILFTVSVVFNVLFLLTHWRLRQPPTCTLDIAPKLKPAEVHPHTKPGDKEAIPKKFCKTCKHAKDFFVQRAKQQYFVFNTVGSDTHMDVLFTADNRSQWRRQHMLTIDCDTSVVTSICVDGCDRVATQSFAQRYAESSANTYIVVCVFLVTSVAVLKAAEGCAQDKPARRKKKRVQVGQAPAHVALVAS